MANLQKIKLLAEKQKITLESLADMVGITVQAIHLMVRKNSTKIETIERIARALNVSVIEFFDESFITERNQITANGLGSVASIKGDIQITNQAPVNYNNVPDADTPTNVAHGRHRLEIDQLKNRVDLLNEKIEMLEKIIAEKDKTIQILINHSSNPHI